VARYALRGRKLRMGDSFVSLMDEIRGRLELFE